MPSQPAAVVRPAARPHTAHRTGQNPLGRNPAGQNPVLQAIAALPPKLAATAALPLFMRVGPRRPVLPDEQHTHLAAERSRVPVPGLHGRGGHALVHTWGSGDRPVLLVHGWSGRAAQLAPLVRELRYAGHSVVAFDAPAHGDAPGRGTFILDFIAAMLELERRHGPFHAVVGHSFGSLAALVAVAEGLSAGRVATVAGMADADHRRASVAGARGLDAAAAAARRERFARRIVPGQANVYGRFSAVRHPLPASVPLLVVHDADDRRVPATEALRLIDAHPGHAELLITQGLGHQRILADDGVLARLTEFVAA